MTLKTNVQMTLKTNIAYTIARWAFLISGFFCLLDAIFITILVMGPYRPLAHSTNWGLGFADYLSKGIPFSASSPDEKIPAESFIMTTKFTYEKNTTTIDSNISKPNANQAEIAGKPLNPGGIGKLFYGPHPEYQPTIKAVRVNEYTFYAWPENAWQRLFLFLPQLLTWLGIVYCSWHMAKLMDKIVDHRVFRDAGYKHLIHVGATIIFLQLCFFVWGHLQPYRYYISIVSPFNNENLYLQGAPVSPFSLQWVVLGLVALLLSKGFHRGVVLKENFR